MIRLRCLCVVPILVAIMAGSSHVQGHDATLSVGSEYAVRFLDVASDQYGDAIVSNGLIAFLVEPCLSWVHACRIFVHNIITGETWDTGYSGTLQDFQYPYLMFEHDEYNLGELDGDGYGYDKLLIVYDVVARSGHIAAENIRWSASLSDGHIAYNKVESYDQIDYDRDGDRYDVAVFLLDIRGGSEMLAGIGVSPFLFGRYLTWSCGEEVHDLCSMDVETLRVVAAGLPWRYPSFDPFMRSGDGDILALSVRDEGDYDGNGVKGEYLLASFNMATGTFEIHLDAGTISFFDLSTSEGKVLAYHSSASNESKHPYGYFVHDLGIGETVDLPINLRLQRPRFHSNSVVANVNVWCVSPPEFDCHPSSNPEVVMYDVATGETQDLDACCVVGGWSGGYDGDTIVLTHNEHILGIDFNGDGDLEDEFVGYATTLLSNQGPLLNDESHHSSASPVDPISLRLIAAISLGVTVFAPHLRKSRVS